MSNTYKGKELNNIDGYSFDLKTTKKVLYELLNSFFKNVSSSIGWWKILNNLKLSLNKTEILTLGN